MFWNKEYKKKETKPWGKRKSGKWSDTKSLREKLDKIYSRYIRLRDSKEYEFKYFRCISCGRVLPYEQGDCGHYISRRNMALRFCEDNTSAQCRSCNRFQDGNIIGYREGLIKKIGIKRVELLEARRHETKKWSKFELEALITYYQEEINKLLNIV